MVDDGVELPSGVSGFGDGGFPGGDDVADVINDPLVFNYFAGAEVLDSLVVPPDEELCDVSG